MPTDALSGRAGSRVGDGLSAYFSLRDVGGGGWSRAKTFPLGTIGVSRVGI